MKKVISIEGMSCKHCAMRVENSLKALDQKAKVKVNLRNNEAEISSKEDISDDKIKQVIEDADIE